MPIVALPAFSWFVRSLHLQTYAICWVSEVGETLLVVMFVWACLVQSVRKDVGYNTTEAVCLDEVNEGEASSVTQVTIDPRNHLLSLGHCLVEMIFGKPGRQWNLPEMLLCDLGERLRRQRECQSGEELAMCDACSLHNSEYLF